MIIDHEDVEPIYIYIYIEKGGERMLDDGYQFGYSRYFHTVEI